jgi:BirA family biotin operon repressor/biotin-[acetyl-CoA-carboxylase] ligase
LYQISALACYDTTAELLHNRQFDIKIKWPNDILVNKYKFAGILIENNLINNQLNWSVIGIGMNINQAFFDKDIKAISLKLATGLDFDVKDVIEKICTNLEKYYLALMNNKLEMIQETYLKHFFGLNTWMDFEIKNEIKNLLVKGISEKGWLLLEEKNGTLLELDVKEMKWLY